MHYDQELTAQQQNTKYQRRLEIHNNPLLVSARIQFNLCVQRSFDTTRLTQKDKHIFLAAINFSYIFKVCTYYVFSLTSISFRRRRMEQNEGHTILL